MFSAVDIHVILFSFFLTGTHLKSVPSQLCFSLKEFLPREYVKTKGIEKKIFAVSHLFLHFIVVIDFCECRTYSLFLQASTQ